MENLKIDFKIGQRVKHRFRTNNYQKCTVVQIEDGCNGSIVLYCEDGFYGKPDTVTLCPQDLKIIK